MSLLLLGLASLLALAQPPMPRTLLAFEAADDMRLLRANNVTLSRVPAAAGGAGHGLRVVYQPSDWPNVTVAAPDAWDWTGADGLAVDITNPGDEPVSFGMRVDDDATANGLVHCRQGGGTVGAHATVSVVMPVGPNPMVHGMRGVPSSGGLTSIGSQNTASLNLAHIVAYQVFLHAPPRPVTLVLDNFRLVRVALSLDGIVNRFGQYSGARWPGKVEREADLASRRASEAAELAAHPAVPGRDRFGGWAGGPRLTATGFFRTERRDGRWWLVTPDGTLFFSLGIDCVGLDGATVITGRERMFQWLPEPGDPLAGFNGQVSGVHSGPVREGRTYDFAKANARRKYGPGFRDAWLDIAMRRLPSWGFNTAGNWSDWGLHRNGRVPYVASGGISGDHARVSDGQDYWGRMHDPFDPRFEASVEQSLRPLTERVKRDPWCIGTFVDNELSWGGLSGDSRFALALGSLAERAAGSPAKRALVAHLRSRYASLADLNQAWGLALGSWDALDEPIRISAEGNAARAKDLGDFTRLFADRYFQTVRAVMRRLDPDHLYLGCRFSGYSPGAVEAAAAACDVVSFNIYAPTVDPAAYALLGTLGKPAIIGEFHFGALDRGMFHTGLVAARDQADRARMYAAYVRSAATNPAIVGCHWFQFQDEPLTGRWFDGENYNIGFVDATDTPYPEMVAGARAVHAAIYAIRTGRERAPGVRSRGTTGGAVRRSPPARRRR